MRWRPRRPAWSVRRRWRVLVVVDIPRWAHDHKTENLRRVLAPRFAVEKRYHADVSAEDLRRADLVMAYYWQQVNGLPSGVLDELPEHLHKLLVGICSHHELEVPTRDTGLALLDSLPRAVFAVNQTLADLYAPLLRPRMFCTPNGVDTDFFRPGPPREATGALRVGWTGSLTNQGPDHRGFHDYIVPAVAAVAGAVLAPAIREERWRTPAEMRDYYRSLDVYVCASRNEGTPNGCLEAAACGVPIVTAPVGNMLELIRDGENGFLVPRDVDRFADALRTLREQPALRASMAARVRRDIAAWSWRRQARNYVEMFRYALEGT